MNLETIEGRRDTLIALRQALIEHGELLDSYDVVVVRIINQLNTKAMTASLVKNIKEGRE